MKSAPSLLLTDFITHWEGPHSVRALRLSRIASLTAFPRSAKLVPAAALPAAHPGSTRKKTPLIP